MESKKRGKCTSAAHEMKYFSSTLLSTCRLPLVPVGYAPVGVPAGYGGARQGKVSYAEALERGIKMYIEFSILKGAFVL